MASVQYGATVTALAGRVGGQNFQRGLASPVLRNISTKRHYGSVTPVGNKIKSIRGLFAYVTQSWRSLTLAQQGDWSDVASDFPRKNKWGATYTPSAYQLFVEFSLGLKYLGLDLVTGAPSTSTFAASVWSVVYAGGGGAITVTMAAPFTHSPYKTIIRASGYQSNGLSLRKGRLKVLQVYQFTSSLTSLDVSSAFYAMFGAATAGMSAFITVNQINATTGEEDVSYSFEIQF